jgi:hypothetical protein
MKELPPVPATFNLENCLNDNHVFANDRWGDCVIAARAHQTMRFETYEQESCPLITDDEVLAEYWMEQGATPYTRKHFCIKRPGWSSKPDNGLTILDSLKSWKKGWVAGGQRLSIYAYGQLDPRVTDYMKASLYSLSGIQVGFALPNAIKGNVEQWNVPIDDGGLWGYHMVYLRPVFDGCYFGVTWGKNVMISIPFVQRYAFNCFGIVDNRNGDRSKRLVDTEKLDNILRQIS